MISKRFYPILAILFAAAATFVLKGSFKTEATAEAAGVLPAKPDIKPIVNATISPIVEMALKADMDPKAVLAPRPESVVAPVVYTKPPVATVVAAYRESEALKSEGRFPEAVASYEKALAIQPELPETYLRLGLLYFKLQMPTQAEEFYLKAIDHGMDNPEVYFHLGYIEEVRGALDKALAYYIKSEQKGSGNPELFYNIGNAYARQGKGAEAIIYYKRVVGMNPMHLDAFVNLSTVSYQLNNFADARFYLDKAVNLGYKAPEEYLKALDSKNAK